MKSLYMQQTASEDIKLQGKASAFKPILITKSCRMQDSHIRWINVLPLGWYIHLQVTVTSHMKSLYMHHTALEEVKL